MSVTTTTQTSPARSAVVAACIAAGMGALALVAIFWPEGRAAVGVWYESTAYGHCFLVVPIALYLFWERRDSLRGLLPSPSPWLAVLGLPLPFAWLVAERLGIMEGRQLVAVAVLELLFLVILGWRLFRAVSGPLLYLFFLVPFGAFITPVLQSLTAWFIDVGLNLLGIPHFVTDMTIEISAGTFYVAEACAGLRFLIASVAFGVFFALLNYTSMPRRVGFMAASIVVPIIANWFRALGIVVLGNILGSAQAAAADHLIYGWFFFSFVTLLLVLGGLPFREPPRPAPAVPGHPGALRPLPLGALLVLALALAGPAAALALNRQVAPVRFAVRPALVAPPGCSLDEASEEKQAPDRFVQAMQCDDRAWTVSIQIAPGRSTGAALAEMRRVAIGRIDAEEVTSGRMPGAPYWQTLVAAEQGTVIATAAWVDGRPATGGIRQRLLQARDSVMGARYDQVLVALALRSGRPMSEAQAGIALSDIGRFIASQPDLNAGLVGASAHGG